MASAMPTMSTAIYWCGSSLAPREHHQPRPFAHTPTHVSGSIGPEHGFNHRTPVLVRLDVIPRPASVDELRMFGETGDEKRPPQGDIGNPVWAPLLGQRHHRQYLGVPVSVAQQVARLAVDNGLDFGAQRGVVLGAQGSVSHYHLRVDDHRMRYRQRVAQSGLSQRVGVHRPQRHDGYGGQHPKRRNRQQSPRRANPAGQQPQQKADARHHGSRLPRPASVSNHRSGGRLGGD